MISERIRGKKLRAASLLEMIEKMEKAKDGKYDPDTLEEVAKKITNVAFVDQGYQRVLPYGRVNEPFEMAELLRRLNDAIDVLYSLDDSYYRDYIFNSSTYSQDDLKKIGFTEEWIEETARKLEQFRHIMYGDNVDWDELAVLMMRDAAYNLREDNLRLEEFNRDLWTEKRKADSKK